MAANKNNLKLKPSENFWRESNAGRLRKLAEEIIKNYGDVAKKVLIVDLIISYLLTGIVRDWFKGIIDSAYERSFVNIFILGIHPLIILPFVLIALLVFFIAARMYNPNTYNEDIGAYQSDTGEAGTSTRIKDGNEKEEFFNCSQGIKLKGDYIGEDLEHPGVLLSVKRKGGLNDNMLIISAPGGGKTRTMLIPDILQAIRRGHSIITTDVKADVAGKIMLLAKAHGYKTKFLNFDPDSIQHSDCVNFFGAMTGSDTACESYVQTIMANLGSGDDKGIWPLQEANLLAFAMLFIKNSADKEHSLHEVAQYLIDHTVDDIKKDIDTLKKKGDSKFTVCLAHGSAWATSDNMAKDSLGGLKVQLVKLMDRAVGKVTSGNLDDNDIKDFELPGLEKCIYFINVSPTKDSLQYLSALYFDIQINELMALGERLGGKLKVPVDIYADEFANIGKLNAWDKKLNTFRSFGIAACMVIQGIDQLEDKYGEAASESIINACSKQILINTNSKKTAQMFVDRSGTGTYVSIDENGVQRKMKRETYTLGEVFQINKHGHALIAVSGANVIETKLVDYSRNPMAVKEITPINALHYTPAWVKNLDPAEYKLYDINPDDFDNLDPENPLKYPKVKLWLPNILENDNYELLPYKPYSMEEPDDGLEIIEKELEEKHAGKINRQKYKTAKKIKLPIEDDNSKGILKHPEPPEK